MAYDVVVLGCGGVGSAALFHLARRGVRVLGIERFAPGHDRGSSHGHTRIIRTAYFEHPDYVPLLRRAWDLWDELEEVAGARLLVRTGVLEVGPPDGEVVPGVRAAAAEHGLAVDEVDAGTAASEFPGLAVPDGDVALFEREAGYLYVEDAVRAHAAAAGDAGAELWTDVTVTGWHAAGDGVRLETTAGPVEAGRLVVTAGAWAGELLDGLGIPLVPVRKQLHWYGQHDDWYDVASGCPVFFHERPHGMFYGFPSVEGRGVKVAEHTGGPVVGDPTTLDRTNDRDEQARVDAHVAECLPGVSVPSTAHAVCMYTRSPDDHFVVDRHPEHPQVVLAAGLSGHGFKFATSLGELLSDLATEGRSQLPHAFLGTARFGTA